MIMKLSNSVIFKARRGFCQPNSEVDDITSRATSSQLVFINFLSTSTKFMVSDLKSVEETYPLNTRGERTHVFSSCARDYLRSLVPFR